MDEPWQEWSAEPQDNLIITPGGGTTLEQLLINEMKCPNLQSVDAMVSYIRKEGVESLRPGLDALRADNIPLRIICTTQFHNSDEEAITELASFEFVEVYVFTDGWPVFHPKCWHFARDEPDEDVFIVGSSNMSGSALHTGFEMNIRVQDDRLTERFQNFFDGTRLHYQLSPYNPNDTNMRNRIQTLCQRPPGGANRGTGGDHVVDLPGEQNMDGEMDNDGSAGQLPELRRGGTPDPNNMPVYTSMDPQAGSAPVDPITSSPVSETRYPTPPGYYGHDEQLNNMYEVPDTDADPRWGGNDSYYVPDDQYE